MKKSIFSLIAGFLLSGCTSRELSNAEKKIYFDYRNCIEKFDTGVLTDNTIQIIPLETTNNSLIARIDKIEIRNNTIYIRDDLAKSVFVFSMDGKYLNKINAIGQGPGEYVTLSGMTVTDSTVLVIDHLMRKQIAYRLPDLRFLKEERVFEKIWAMDIFTLKGVVCYLNEWSNSRSGKYRLFSRKVDEMDFDRHLPFEKEPISLGISGPQYAVNGNEASLIFSGDPVIYRYNSQGEAYPEYEIIFKNKKVEYTSGKVENVFNNNPPGCILNINAINESDVYLFIDISVTTDNKIPMQSGNYDKYTCLYNKLNHETIIYPSSRAFNSKFDDERVSVRRIIDNRLITWREASSMVRLHNDESYTKRIFTDKIYEKRLKEVLSVLDEEDNPILFIYNLQ